MAEHAPHRHKPPRQITVSSGLFGVACSREQAASPTVVTISIRIQGCGFITEALGPTVSQSMPVGTADDLHGRRSLAWNRKPRPIRSARRLRAVRSRDGSHSDRSRSCDRFEASRRAANRDLIPAASEWLIAGRDDDVQVQISQLSHGNFGPELHQTAQSCHSDVGLPSLRGPPARALCRSRRHSRTVSRLDWTNSGPALDHLDLAPPLAGPTRDHC